MDTCDKNIIVDDEENKQQIIQNSYDEYVDNTNYEQYDFFQLESDQQKELAFRFFNENQFVNLCNILNKVKGLDIMTFADKKSYTLLHRFVLNQNIDSLHFIIQYARNFMTLQNYQENDIKQKIAEWLNFQNDGGFTALHYASYRGDIRLLKYIIQLGGNYKLPNNKGLNAIHIAAQGDQPISIRYLQKIGMNTHLLDLKQGNALHWACFLGNEKAVNYLTSYTDIDINQHDSQGLTPLHLAVISGNARAVKRLLLKGANRKMVDSKGKTPGELAIQEGYETLAQMIDNEDGFQEYCNLRQPFRPLNKSVKQVVIFFLLFLLVQGLFLSFIVPCMDQNFIEFSIWSSLSIISTIFQIIVWQMNPGEVRGVNNKECLRNLRSKQPDEQIIASSKESDIKIKQKNKQKIITQNNQTTNNAQRENTQQNSISQNQNQTTTAQQNNEIFQENQGQTNQKKQNKIFDSLQQFEENKSYLQPLLENEQKYISKDDVLMLLLKNFPIEQLCLDCQIVKPHRSKHCEICKKCIRVYDHHCPWVNNCVGAHNYKYFIAFIILLWFCKLSIIIFTLLHIMNKYNNIHDGSIFSYLVWFRNLSQSNQQILYYTKYGASSIILAITIPFFFMLSILCYVQLKNLFLNLTTYERFNSKAINDQNNDPSSIGSNSNNLDSEMFNNSQTKDQSGQQIKKRPKINFHPQKKCSFSNAYEMCCVNSKNDQLNFNKKICVDQMTIQEKEEQIYY